MEVRLETHRDVAGIRSLVEQAFPTVAEAGLVDALRGRGDAAISVVAEDHGVVVGHAMLSRMNAPFPALGLAPVAVAPARQRVGIGRRIVQHALDLAAEGDWVAVFVLGDPAYYGRFGFSAEHAKGFASPYAGPHLMIRLLSGELPTRSGRVDYAPAFAALG